MAEVLDSRQRQGEQVSTSLSAATMTDGFFGLARLEAIELADPLFTLTFTVEGLFGATWRLLTSAVWSGGGIQRSDHLNPASPAIAVQPTWSFRSSAGNPSDIRLRVTPSRRCRFAADLTVR